MDSPSLSLTFSGSIIIFRGFAKASAALNVLLGAALGWRFAANAAEAESEILRRDASEASRRRSSVGIDRA